MFDKVEEIDIKAGQLIVFSRGQYSDFGYNGHFVALENINRAQVNHVKRLVEEKNEKREAEIEEWMKTREGPWPDSVDKYEAFIAEMIRSGFLVSIDVRELYLGSYDDLEL